MPAPKLIVAQDFREGSGDWLIAGEHHTTLSGRGCYIVAPERALLPAPVSWSALDAVVEMQFRLESGSAGIFCGTPVGDVTGYLMSMDDSAGYLLQRIDDGSSTELDSGVIPKGMRSDYGDASLLRMVCDSAGHIFVTLNGSSWQRVSDDDPLALAELRPGVAVQGSATIEGIAILGAGE